MSAPRRSGETSSELAYLNRGQGVAESDPFTVDRYRQFAGHLSGSPLVLDVGCNTGRGGSAFKAELPGARIVGLEMLPERVEQIPNGLYESVTGESLDDHPRPDGGYNAILMGELIEHVPWAGIDPLLFAAHELLAPGGQLLLTTPNPHYVLLGRRSRGSVLGGPHVSVHCAEALCQYLAFRSFDIENLHGTGRVSLRVGTRLPLPLYGAYMVIARKR